MPALLLPTSTTSNPTTSKSLNLPVRRSSSSQRPSSSSQRPACLLDLFGLSPQPSSPARASVEYVRAVASLSYRSSSDSLNIPPLSSPSPSSSCSSGSMSMALPSPPHHSSSSSLLTRSTSLSSRPPLNPPTKPVHTRAHSSSTPPTTIPHIPTRSERLLLLTLSRCPPTPPSPNTPEPDWLTEVLSQTCTRPSPLPPRVGKTTSRVHIASASARPTSPTLGAKERERARREERERAGEGATFAPAGALWLSASPSPAGGLGQNRPVDKGHADWPWGTPPSKPGLSRAKTSPTGPMKASTQPRPRPVSARTSLNASSLVGASRKAASASLKTDTPPASNPASKRNSTASTSSRLHTSTSPTSTISPTDRSPITPPPSPPFDARTTSLLLKHKEGYVSFRELEGLGAPAGEDDEEERERERERERRGRWWGWWGR